MLKNAFYVLLFALISWGTYQISYPSNTKADLYYEGVFFENIIKHLHFITQGKRAVGDYYHDDVQRYLVKQLNAMGFEVSKQKSTAFNPNNRSAAPIRNIIAKLPGSKPENKSLVLMAHYDAAKFSGVGAADDASGVAVILGVVKAFIQTNQTHSNNIIVLFTDAEEIGLLGAHAFINEQLQNHDVGLIINLEARGSSGPVMMWPETVGGNRSMIESYQAANVPMPVTTSLHYEIYKMLPNDTDLTPFKELGKINGFNLAFIDDHFNYHTQLDNLQNLSLNTVAHQTIQTFSMLKYFANSDLSQLKSEQSLVYFSIPTLGLFSYPVWVNWLLLIIITVILVWQLFKSASRPESTSKSWIRSLLAVFIASGLAFAWCWLSLSLVELLFPENKDILQGFPYQGHVIIACLLISAALIAVSVFGWFNRKDKNTYPQSFISVVVWLFLLYPLAYFMPGSGLLILPVLLAALLLISHNYSVKLAEQLAPIFAVLSFILLGAVIINLPIAMGIDSLPVTAVILVLLISLFVPLISPVKKIAHGILLLIAPFLYLIISLHLQPNISIVRPHPTSVSYLYDVDNQQGHYFNYDEVQSGWNTEIFNQLSSKQDHNDFYDLYRKPVKNLSAASPVIELVAIDINAKKPLQNSPNKIIDFTISAHNNTEVIEIYTKQAITVHRLSIEGRNAVLIKPIKLTANRRLLQYYFDGNKQINLQLEVSRGDQIDWQVQSHGLDLLNNPDFGVKARPVHQIPKPFIKSDNTVVVQSFTFGLD